jgi:spectinomycin phosphotransferase
MRGVPEDLDERDLVNSLSHGWGLRIAGAEYVAVGGGSYHWRVDDASGRRHWVTADDLDQKGYLGDTRDSAFGGLRCALDTALALRAGGLEFVVSPVATPRGETVWRLGRRHAVALFPFIEGSARQFGERLATTERNELVDMLVRLHRATPWAAPMARRTSLQLSERASLEEALRDLDSHWTGGPFSEAARALVASHARHVRRLLDTFDDLAGQVMATGTRFVITHGEPHPGNVMMAGGRLLLVDWDTAALAPPERDLWMLSAGDALERYVEASVRPIDDTAIRLYRLRWRLDDIASFLKRLRSAHRQTADTEHAWRSLVVSLEPQDT